MSRLNRNRIDNFEIYFFGGYAKKTIMDKKISKFKFIGNFIYYMNSFEILAFVPSLARQTTMKRYVEPPRQLVKATR